MTRAVLELNDLGLLMQSEGGELLCEPGFAQLSKTGIVCGESARGQAWLQPQFSHNQYWRQLNQLAMPVKSPWARHYADIAFAQLQQLHQLAAAPESLIAAVPGSFNQQQQSLLLGMLSALPVQVEAVVDSALATCLAASGDTLLVDLQLHQTVLSHCQWQAGELQLVAQQVIPDLGLMTLYNAVARHISRRLIEDVRFDPLHNSTGEQAIYDQLPRWLAQLLSCSELSVTIPSPQGELPLLLRKADLAGLLATRCENLTGAVRRLLASHPDARLGVTYRSRLLAGFIDTMAAAEVFSQASALTNCFRYGDIMVRHSEPVHCLRSLPVAAAQQPLLAAVTPARVSHLLYQHCAWPLRQPLSIRLQGELLALSCGVDEQADVVLVLQQQQLTVLQQSTSTQLTIPERLACGITVQIGQHHLPLIEVNDG